MRTSPHEVASSPASGSVPDTTSDGAIQRAVAAFARAVQLSCLAAHRHAPRLERAEFANQAVAAHIQTQALAEEAVRRAGA